MPVDIRTKNGHVNCNIEKRKINLQYFVVADVACPMLRLVTRVGDPPG